MINTTNADLYGNCTRTDPDGTKWERIGGVYDFGDCPRNIAEWQRLLDQGRQLVGYEGLIVLQVDSEGDTIIGFWQKEKTNDK